MELFTNDVIYKFPSMPKARPQGSEAGIPFDWSRNTFFSLVVSLNWYIMPSAKSEA